ncbi:MAG: carboxypeptidase regulatory-like domain-containing protein [Cyanobacteria bacterium]|nr:carboxypeptidase regulatory-like domain-containing protein [Cyanobacteriota bacterium]
MRTRLLPSLAVLLLVCATVSTQAQQLRKIGEMELALVGLSATVDGARPAIPKNVASGVKILIRGGGGTLTPADAASLLGAFDVAGELSGPSFGETVTVRQRILPATAGPDVILPLPVMAVAGEHTLSNLRIVNTFDAPLLDLQPQVVPVNVVDQVLITSVRTRPLTLQEIKDKGIVLDSDDYLGFEFTLGVLLESKPVKLAFPVVFDRQGIAVPLPQSLPALDVEGLREPVIVPKLVPMMMKIPKLGPGSTLGLNFREDDIKIPSLLVIPGEVGFLKQFFSAQLFVGNGTPATANLTVRNLSGTITLPDNPDANSIDPLSLAETINGPQPATMTIAAAGPDGKPGTPDDVASLRAGEQGMAEFLVRGDAEGFHNISFDIEGVLDGLPTGPITVTGTARGGVLVRNPFFDVSFTLPTVVRAEEPFKLYATVTNKGQGIANDVSMTLDSGSLSGVQLLGSGTRSIPMLKPGEAETLVFDFKALRTGQAVATYLKFEGDGATGGIRFRVGVGERGVPLSPDTLVLPASVDELPAELIAASMRVLGQAWSIANTPPNAMPAGVIRMSKSVVTARALALAEAGLRIRLGQPAATAIRDLLPDFYGPAPIDRGFDQLLRMTDAGRNFNRAVGAALANLGSTNASAVEEDFARIAASGRDFVSFAIQNGTAGADAGIRLTDSAGRALVYTGADGDPRPAVASAVIAPLGDPQDAPVFGVIAAPAAMPYTLELSGRGSPADISITYPRGDGSFTRATASGVFIAAGGKARIVIDPSRASPTVDVEADGEGSIATSTPLTTETITAAGPQFLSASVVGPETFQTAGPFGFNVALLFDRIVDNTASADRTRYSIPDNEFYGARRQLSGRIVLGTLAFPEGPYVPSAVTVSGMTDVRGVAGGTEVKPLQSLLEAPGAVVSGRVINGDGQLAAGVRVIYSGNSSWSDCQSTDTTPFAAAVTDAQGRYQFRYVYQDRCGVAFGMRAIDEVRQSQRLVSGKVRTAGERIAADIALLGRGSIAGTVRNLSGQPVPGAQVIAVSTLETNVGGATTTDGDGRYLLSNITVGPVSIRAAKGLAVGAASGQISRAGMIAQADLTLNDGRVSLSGVIKTQENGVLAPAPGAIVVYETPSPLGGPEPIVAGVATTAIDGGYSFTGMPTGPYTLRARIATSDFISFQGIATAGDVITGRNLIIEVVRNAVVSGVVQYPDGSVAPRAVVLLSSRGVVAGEDGTFTIEGVRFQSTAQTIRATSADGLREGTANVLVNLSGQQVSNVLVTLNGIGTLNLAVIDSAGNPVRNQIVQIARTGRNASPNDCTAFYLATTDNDGRAQFAGLEVGQVRAVSLRATVTGVDVAKLDTAIPFEGAEVNGVLRFGGGGGIRGTVTDDTGAPVFGATVEVSSRIYESGSCSLVPGVSHRIRTGVNGTYRVTGVPVGAVSVRISQEFYPTPIGASRVLARDGDELVIDVQLINSLAERLVGTVFLPDGVTSAGAGVSVTAKGALPDVVVTTNDQGYFAFPEILPIDSYRVTIRDPASGGVAQEVVRLKARVPNVEPVPHDFRLKGRGTVRIKVVDGGNVAVSGALVTLKESGFPFETFEGVVEPSNEGVVTFENVSEGDFSVSASDIFGRGGRVSGELPSDGATVDVTVRLTVTGTVTGRFLMPDGVTAIPFGALKLLANGRVIGQATSDSGENAGAFAFTYVPAGTVRIEGLDPATGRSGVAVGQIVSDGQALILDVKAQGLGTVTGQVTQNGNPQAGARVSVSSGTFKAQTTADGNGVYGIPGVPEGQVTVNADLAGALQSSTAGGTLIGEGGSVTIDVQLQPTGTVTGAITRANSSLAAPPSIVTIMVGNTRFSSTTDDQGAYRIDLVPAGARTVTVDVIGSIDTARGSANVASGDTVVVNLSLTGVGSISGYAQAANGSPAGGTVTLTGTGVIAWSATVTVNPDGSFAAAQVLAGPFTAKVRHSSGAATLYGTSAGTVTPDQTASVTVTLQSTGDVHGTVLRPGGSTPAIGAAVRLFGNGVDVTAQAFSTGEFSFTGLPLGTYTISVYDPATNAYARALNVTLAQNGDTFETGALVLDNGVVSVASISPVNGAIGVLRTQPVVVTFTDPLSSTAGVNVKQGVTTLGASRSLSADGRTLTLSGTWPDSSELTIAVTTGVVDVFGRHLVSTMNTVFTTVDTTAPAVSIVSPPDDAIEAGVSAPIVVTFSEPVANASFDGLIAVTRSGIVVTGSTAQGPANVLTFTPSPALAGNAIYTVTVDGAVDATGNEQGAAKITRFATTDTVPPALSISAPPQSDAWLKDNTPAIVVLRSDATSGIETTSGVIAIDGIAVTTSRSSGAISHTVPAAAALADGTHVFTASSADRAGNTATIPGTFKIDATAPSVAAIDNIGDGPTVAGTTTITATATDALSGVDFIEIFRDGLKILTLEDTAGFSGTWNSASTSEGRHLLTAKATDYAGNAGPTSDPTTIVVDNDPIVLAITSPAAGFTTRRPLTATATVSEPVIRVDFTLGGVTITGTAAGNSHSALLPVNSLPEGNNTLTVTAIGLLSEVVTGTRTIVIDRSTPVARWPFDEGAGTTTADATGNGHPGTLENGAAWLSIGRFSKAISFDGIDDGVQVADHDDFDASTGVSMTAWVAPQTFGAAQSVIYRGGAYALSLETGGRVTAVMYPNGVATSLQTTAPIPLNQWTHLAATYDQATLRIYVNGIEAASTPVSGVLANADGDVWLGRAGVTDSFNGKLDEVRIYDRALSNTEVAALVIAPVARRIAAANEATLIAQPGGPVWGFGRSGSGDLGQGGSAGFVAIPRPGIVAGGLNDIVQLAAGDSHSLALTNTGTVYVFGSNSFGQLGDTGGSRSTPSAMTLDSIVAIAAGRFHSVALRSNGDVVSWGRNESGQQVSADTSATFPIPHVIMTGATAIAAGAGNTLIVKNDGTVWGVGQDGNGQLGSGSTANVRSTFVQMSGITTAVEVASGNTFSVVRLADGTLKAAGGGGVVGDGSSGSASDRTTPVSVLDLTGVTRLAVGLHHTLALKSDRTVWVWGQNTSGALGDGDESSHTRGTPYQLPGLANIVDIGAGWNGSHAITDSGVVFGWGNNGWYETGDGVNNRHRYSPVAVSIEDYLWKTATPSVDIDGGTFSVNKIAIVDNIEGPDVRTTYTRNGVEPAFDDEEVPANGQVQITTTQTLTVKSFRLDGSKPPSNTEQQVFILQPATPAITPTDGSNLTAPQNVTMSVSTAGAVVRYAIGTPSNPPADPTDASTEYPGSAITIAGPAVVKARAFIAGWTPSLVRTATFNYALPAPSISPNGGTFAGSVAVTLSAIPGASIFYTTVQGGTPDIAYAGPFTLTDNRTVRARATHPDYPAASAIAQAAFTITQPTTNLLVRYRTPDGVPVPGATVFYQRGGVSRSANTDAAGYALLTNTGIGDYSIYALGPEDERQTTSVAGTITPAQAGQTVSVDFAARPIGGPITVRLLAADGVTPAPFFTVTDLENPWEGGSRQADATGTVEFASAVAGEFIQITVRFGDSEITQTVHRLSDGPFDIPIVLPVGVIRGVVTYADGSAVEAASVTAEQQGASWTNYYYAVADPNVAGGYVIAGPIAGDVNVTAQDPVSSLMATTTVTIAGVATPVTANLALPPTGTVRGTVRTSSNQPVPFVDVAISTAISTVYATTDENGEYIAPAVPIGEVTAYVYFGFGVQGAASGTLANGGDTLVLDVELPPYGTVSGTVRHADGAPVNESVLVELTHATYGQFATWSNPDGTYSFDPVAIGDVSVQATLTSVGVTGTASGTLANSGDTLTVDVTLAPLATVSGTLRREDGSAAPFAWIYLQSGSGPVRVVQTSAAGAYSFNNVPFGTVSVIGYEANVVGQTVLEVTAGTATIDVTLQAASLTVIVQNSSGQNVSGSFVQTATPTGTFLGTVANSAGNVPSGGVTFTRHAAGTVTITATRQGKSQTVTVTHVTNVPQTVTIILPP